MNDLRFITAGLILYIAALVATVTVLAILGLAFDWLLPDAPSCFEDQAVVWDGTEHTICVNLDDLP